MRNVRLKPSLITSQFRQRFSTLPRGFGRFSESSFKELLSDSETLQVSTEPAPQLLQKV